MEEALWDLEDKLKLSTQGAFLILASASFALVAICTIIILKRKARRNKIAHQEGDISDDIINGQIEIRNEPESQQCGWVSLRSVLLGSMVWSKACRWEEKVGSQRKKLFGLERHSVEVGRQSHNSVSAVWQRPILRGEKCELPRFSGLILYDEKGRLLSDSHNQVHSYINHNLEKEAVTVRTTLRELL
ncbi:putative transmembrane protein [Senna tora]|uniref:Putative transmembrane protein n=1 Tax=Senna tora TaxID=362788 RepID=A0A834TK52_9FABA|nr:putative transmembrane protein [Senna tora]